jgi:hypothetical protein
VYLYGVTLLNNLNIILGIAASIATLVGLWMTLRGHSGTGNSSAFPGNAPTAPVAPQPMAPGSKRRSRLIRVSLTLVVYLVTGFVARGVAGTIIPGEGLGHSERASSIASAVALVASLIWFYFAVRRSPSDSEN